MIKLEDAEARFDAALLNPTLTRDELNAEVQLLLYRGYRDPDMAKLVYQRWLELDEADIEQRRQWLRARDGENGQAIKRELNERI